MAFRDFLRRLALALAGSLLLSAGWSAAAEDPAKSAEERRVAEHRKALAVPMGRLAGWCLTKDLEQTARALDRGVIQFHPGDASSRLRLGHRFRDGKWREPDSPLPPVRDAWTRDKWVQYRERRSGAIAETSKILLQEIKRLRASVPSPREAELWYQVLEADPLNEDALTALRFWAKVPLPFWVKHAPRNRTEREAWLAQEVRAPAGEDFVSPLPGDPVDSLGRRSVPGTTWQAASDRFVVDTTLGRDAAIHLLNRAHDAVAALDRLVLLPGIAGRSPGPWNLVVVSGTEYPAVLDRLRGSDPALKGLPGPSTGTYPGERVYLFPAGDPASAAVRLLHRVAEHRARQFWADRAPPWFREGVALVLMEALVKEGGLICAGTPEAEEWRPMGPASGWGPAVLEDLSTGNLPGLPTLFSMEGKDMNPPAALAAWSFLWWVRETDPLLLHRLASQLLADPDFETAILNSFGCPSAVVDRAWRDWIRDQFIPEK